MSARRTPQARGDRGRFAPTWRVRGRRIVHIDPLVELDRNTPDETVVYRQREAPRWVGDVAVALFGLAMLAALVYVLVVWAASP